MRVFNQAKTQELTNYDLSKGYLKQDKLFIAYHPEQKATQGSYRIKEKTYPNGGKSIEKVWDILPTPYKEAYEEYEDIQVYVPYTEEELALKKHKEYTELCKQLIAKKYPYDKENKVQRKYLKDLTNPEAKAKFDEYNAYVEECLAKAKEIIYKG